MQRQAIYHGEIPFSNAGTTIFSPPFTHESREVLFYQHTVSLTSVRFVLH